MKYIYIYIGLGICVLLLIPPTYGAVNSLIWGDVDSEDGPMLGSTITTILSTDLISASRAVINTNFANLNTDKLERTGSYGTTTNWAITGLLNCDSIDTAADGSLQCGSDSDTVWSTTSSDFWYTVQNAWATTSTDFWETTQSRWSTSSEQNFWNTTSTWTGFDDLFDTRFIATTTWSGDLTVNGDLYSSNILNSGTATTTELCFADNTCQSSVQTITSEVIFYLHEEDDPVIAGYEILSRATPDDAEMVDSCAVSNGYCAIDEYITPADLLNTTEWPAGEWVFHTYASNLSGSTNSYVKVEVYKRAIGGTETQLFSATSTQITSIQPLVYDFSSIQGAFTVNADDRLVVKYQGYNSGVPSRTINLYYEGTAHTSRIKSPFLSNVDLGSYTQSNVDETITGSWNFANATSTNLGITGLAGGGTLCLQIANDGSVGTSASACGTGSGGSAAWEMYNDIPTWMTPTTTAAGIYLTGSATTTANLYVTGTATMGNATTTGSFYATNDLRTNTRLTVSTGSDGYLYFDADAESLMWDDSETMFKLSDDLEVTGTASSTVALRINDDIIFDSTGRGTTTGQMFVETDRVVGWKDPSATFVSSTLATFTAATTTIRLGVAVANETWGTMYCYTDAGTTTVRLLDSAGNATAYFDCAREQSDVFPTANTLSSNNTFTTGEHRKWEIGGVLGSPTQVSITIKKSIDPD